jgi:hypothetical protein
VHHQRAEHHLWRALEDLCRSHVSSTA